MPGGTPRRALLDRLARDEPAAMSGVGAIGLSGQMHGAVLLGADDRPLRPAMLWNDGRAAAEALGAAHQPSRICPRIVGVLPMAGFTGPKMPWLARHEPGILPRLRTVMLPKDYVRLMLTGEKATDMSDAAGHLVARRGPPRTGARGRRRPPACLSPHCRRILESAAPAGAAAAGAGGALGPAAARRRRGRRGRRGRRRHRHRRDLATATPSCRSARRASSS